MTGPDGHDDLGFASTGAWDAPPQGDADLLVTPPAADEGDVAPGPAPQPWTEGVPEPDDSVGSGAHAGDDLAAPNGDRSSDLERDGSTGIDSEDSSGPPAPFFMPPSVAVSAETAVAPPDHELRPERDDVADGPPAPAGGLSDSEAGRTLPFWSVPSQPESRRGRLGLPRLARLHLRRPRLGRPTRAGVMRALPIILVAVGGLLLVEGVLTVVWKEPFSALVAARTQSALGDNLEVLERKNAAAAEAASRDRKAMERYQRRQAVSVNRDTGVGEATGRLRVPKIDLKTVVVQGTDDATLQAGPGHYTQTPLPGQKGNWTVGIAGHRTTYDAPFRNIDKLKRGDEIVYTLPYGKFTYEVEGTKIVDAAETGVFIPKGYDRIALTACHPLYSDAQRIIAYGKLKKSEPRDGAQQAGRS